MRNLWIKILYISNDAASLKYYNFDVLYLNHAYDNIYAILMYLYNRIITLSLFVKSACREQYLMNESVFVWCNIGWKYIVDPKLCLHCWHAQVFLICYNLYSYKKGGGGWIFSGSFPTILLKTKNHICCPTTLHPVICIFVVFLHGEYTILWKHPVNVLS